MCRDELLKHESICTKLFTTRTNPKDRELVEQAPAAAAQLACTRMDGKTPTTADTMNVIFM